MSTERLWQTERRVRAIAIVALVTAVAYLGWRIGFTLGGAPAWLAVTLVVAEAWAIGQLALFAYQAWRVPEADPPSADPPPESAGVLVRMLGGDTEALERTLIGCSRLDGLPRVTVVAGPDDPELELENLSRRHGAAHVWAADGSLREALRAAPGEIVLILRAGEVPPPDTLRVASGRLRDLDVGATQCAVEFANPDALTHVLAGRSEQELVTRVLGPALGARGIAQSSASALVVRRSSFAAAVPSHARDATQEALLTETNLLAAGYRIEFQRTPAVRTLGPDSVRDYVAGARSRAAGSLRFLISRQGPLFGRRVPVTLRFALAARASRYLSGIHRLVLLALVIGMVLSGQLPFGTSVGAFALAAVPAYALIGAAWLALGRGALDPGDRTRYALRTMGAHCRGAVVALLPLRWAPALLGSRGSDAGSLRQLGLLVVTTLALDAALIARGLNDRLDLGLPAQVGALPSVAVLGAGLVTLAFMLDVLQLVGLRRQDRGHFRVPVGLSATIDNLSARCLDLTPDGLRLEVPSGREPERGSRVTVGLALTELDGSSRAVELPAIVRRAFESADGTTLGLQIARDDTDRDARDAVAAYYWVIRPAQLAARGTERAGTRAEGGFARPTEPLPARTRVGRVGLRGASLGAAAAAVLAAIPVVALAALPQQSGAVDLSSEYNVRIDMAGAGDSTGAAEVQPAGDVNNDGFDDIIVGSDLADPLGRSNAGAAYVVFGSATPSDLDAASLGSAGFRIAGASAGALAGDAATGAGDVNNDGYDDIVVGAEGEGSGAGAAYVVFGSATPADVDLASLGASGFRITDNEAGSSLGQGVAGLGDLNADGLHDVLVSAHKADPSGRTSAGAAYVVFGTASTSEVDVDVAGPWGYAIHGASVGDRAGWRAAAVGDVSDDDVADMVLTARDADPGGRTDAGAAYVIFGKSSTSTIDLASLGANGFRIDGASASDALGSSAAGVADTNGDSTPDIIVGAHAADNNGRTNSGSAYVVYGKSSTTSVDLASLGAGGFRIDGSTANDYAGYAVAPSNDLDGDGLADAIVGAYGADPLSRTGAGAAYVVYGTASPTDVDLASLGSAGVEIRGAAADDSAGRQVGGGQFDLNGDGRLDVLVGAHAADNNARTDSGSVYVVYGFGTPSVDYAPTSLTLETGQPMSAITPTIARTGPATFSVSPALPGGLVLNASTGEISGTPGATVSQTTYTVTMTDLAGQDTDLIDITTGQQAPIDPGRQAAPGGPGGEGAGAVVPPAPQPTPGVGSRRDLPDNAATIPPTLPVRYDPKRDAFLIRVRFRLRQRGLCVRACRATSTIHERVKRTRAPNRNASGKRVDPWRTRARLGRTGRLRIRSRKLARFEIPVKRPMIGRRATRKGSHLVLLVRLRIRLRTAGGTRRVRKDSLIRVGVKRYKTASALAKRRPTAHPKGERGSRGSTPVGRGSAAPGGRP